jgi:diphthine-ammonia ligase
LWTGGKDSCLALLEAKQSGYDVRSLVTFVPTRPRFLAHPLNFMKCQSEALALPHYTLHVRNPFKQSYQNAIRSLRDEHGIATLVTGDIAQVDGHPNWMRECCENLNINVLTPLWGFDRCELVKKFLSCKFKAVFSCVKKPWFTMEWLARELDNDALEDLLDLNAKTGLDVCGEQGEYHTLTLDGPLFEKSISIDEYSKEEDSSLFHIQIRKVSLKDKVTGRIPKRSNAGSWR